MNPRFISFLPNPIMSTQFALKKNLSSHKNKKKVGKKRFYVLRDFLPFSPPFFSLSIFPSLFRRKETHPNFSLSPSHRSLFSCIHKSTPPPLFPMTFPTRRTHAHGTLFPLCSPTSSSSSSSYPSLPFPLSRSLFPSRSRIVDDQNQQLWHFNQVNSPMTSLYDTVKSTSFHWQQGQDGATIHAGHHSHPHHPHHPHFNFFHNPINNHNINANNNGNHIAGSGPNNGATYGVGGMLPSSGAPTPPNRGSVVEMSADDPGSGGSGGTPTSGPAANTLSTSVRSPPSTLPNGSLNHHHLHQTHVFDDDNYDGGGGGGGGGGGRNCLPSVVTSSSSSTATTTTTTAQVTYSARSSSLRREEDANVIPELGEEMIDPLNQLHHPLHPLHPLHQLHHRAPNYEDAASVAMVTGIGAPTPPPLPASSSMGTAASKTVICVTGSVDSTRPPATPLRGTPLSPSGTPLGSNSLAGTPILTPKVNHTSTPIPTPMSTPKLGEYQCGREGLEGRSLRGEAQSGRGLRRGFTQICWKV